MGWLLSGRPNGRLRLARSGYWLHTSSAISRAGAQQKRKTLERATGSTSDLSDTLESDQVCRPLHVLAGGDSGRPRWREGLGRKAVEAVDGDRTTRWTEVGFISRLHDSSFGRSLTLTPPSSCACSRILRCAAIYWTT